MISLDGKKIFVSGAAAGMGQCVAKLAAISGAEVYATDVSPVGLNALQKHDVKISTLDVTKPKDVQRYFANQPDFDGIVIWLVGFIMEIYSRRMKTNGGSHFL